MIRAIAMLKQASMSMRQTRQMMAEISTATEIKQSFMVSAPEAVTTVDLILCPVFLRQSASRYLVKTLAIRTIIVGNEQSTSSGSRIFSIDSWIIWKPTNIIIIAMIIVVIRSIFSRFLVYFLKPAIFSVTIIRIPEIASIKLCKASEIMAREFDTSPTTILKIERRILIRINR